MLFFLFKQKTAYEMRISDWSSDVCSSDLVVERIVEAAARELKMDPVELRKKNFVPPDAFPYQTPVACVYDSGQYAKAIDEACKMADYAGFPKRKADAAQKGQLRGIGF